MKSSILLLKTLLLSTSRRNIYKYSKDKKNRGKIVGTIVGGFFLFLLLAALCIFTCIGYAYSGQIDSVPVMNALTVSLIALVFTFFKTNGYLFGFKEYDALMSLPFKPETVAGCKFLYMYIKSLPWYLGLSISMLIGYGIFARPAIYIYPLWIVLSLFLPLIPMLIASFFGFLIMRISSGFKKTNLVQVMLSFILIIFAFSLRFIIEDMIRNNKVEATMNMLSGATDNAAGIYLPAKWFADAITKSDLLGVVLLIFVSALLFALIFHFVGRTYGRINSAIKSHSAARNYKLGHLKKRNVTASVAFKEYRRMMGSTAYTVNGAMGEILALILGIVTLFISFDGIISMITRGAVTESSLLRPAIPFVVYFFIGMAATTSMSPSLEGKNFWIIKSLPLDMKTVVKGKMLFNLYLTLPFSLFATICMCISARTPLVEAALYIILSLVLCCFSTAWGCVCGIKHIKLAWENEIEVIKQGAAVTLYILPNMFVCMGLWVLSVFLGTILSHLLVALIFIIIYGLLALLSYVRSLALSKRM
ncbi:MAG: hypothetical protein E7241_10700 [Lachnospiraceae bacterium]|nr:hypothetical protein [Lachnospiraceae bacterium]